MPAIDLPIRAACDTATQFGITPDRCDILQDGSTLVLRLTETLVARVVVDRDGPRQGDAWFARENAIARHLTRHGAPIIPLHPDLPPGPHEHHGFTMNFWEYVTIMEVPPLAEEIGTSLHRCHSILQEFPEPLPELAIMTETIELLETLRENRSFPESTLTLLHRHLSNSLRALSGRPFQALHGDSHPGNLLNTTRGLLWTDWEDAFSGPVEWDLASIIWNARILDGKPQQADGILDAYRHAGGNFEPLVLEQCLIARAAVMSAWYPVLYPNPDAERAEKLRFRLDWLASKEC